MKAKLFTIIFILSVTFFGMSDFARADQEEDGKADRAVLGTEKDVPGAELFGTAPSNVLRAAQKQREAEQDAEQDVKEYFFDVPAEAVYQGTGMTAVRSAPSKSAAVIRYLTKDDTVTAIAECTVGANVWYYVYGEEYKGYLCGENVKLSMSEETDFDPFPEESTEAETTETAEETGETEPETQDPAAESALMAALESEEAEKERAQSAVLAAAMEAAYGEAYVPEETTEASAGDISEGEQKLQEIEAQLARQDIAAPGSEEQRFQSQAMQLQAEILRAALAAAGVSEENIGGGNTMQAENAMREQQRREAEARREAERKAQIAFGQAIENGAKEAAGTKGREIADYAASWVGKIHYGWGCNDFREGGSVDCSHFTYNVFRNFRLVGSYLTSWGQREWGSPVSESDIRPGDLVCYNGHVAIYYGGGIIVHAPSAGHDVEFAYLNIASRYGIRRLCD